MTQSRLSPDEVNEAIRDRYVPLMAPLFYPERPPGRDFIEYIASLLRVVGAEDKGWDPYTESRAVLDDLYALMKIDLPKDKFSGSQLTRWRLALIFYNHIVEMNAPYEVITNLLRFRLGKGYSPNPYWDFLSDSARKQFKRSGLFPKQKITIIKKLDKEANVGVGDIFDEFYRPELRNAISHSDFVFADEELRSRKGYGIDVSTWSFAELDDLITKAKVFVGTFFALERDARQFWAAQGRAGICYDSVFKGILEILVDDGNLMNGFKVHWPNGSDSLYRRTSDGIDMVNCMLDLPHATLQMFVGSYARRRGTFSPLVEVDGTPSYSRLEGSDTDLTWYGIAGR